MGGTRHSFPTHALPLWKMCSGVFKGVGGVLPEQIFEGLGGGGGNCNWSSGCPKIGAGREQLVQADLSSCLG